MGSGGAPTTASSANSEVHEVQGLEDLERVGTLGHGSGGFVEKHLRVRSGSPLALKVIQAGDIAEAQRKAILVELRTFRKCQNPHIVDFYGAFFHESSICIALEYMDAGALSTVLEKRGTVPERTLANITWQVLDGLEYLHGKMRVIHRDIKPSNLLLNSAGVVKITDFGVSGELEDDLEKKDKVTFVGTMYYMSPERVNGKPYGYNSDMWSLGLTVIECFSGRYPYARCDETSAKQLSFWELMRRIDQQDAPSLLPGSGASEGLQGFVQQVLQKEPQDRPNAAVMKAHAWLGGPPSQLERMALAEWVGGAGGQQEFDLCSPTTQTPSDASGATGSNGAPDSSMARSVRGGGNPFARAATPGSEAADSPGEGAALMGRSTRDGTNPFALGGSMRHGGGNPFADT